MHKEGKYKQSEKAALHKEGKYKQSEKAAFRMEEDNRKWNNWQRIKFQNIQTAHAPQYQKKRTTQSKSGPENKTDISPRRHTDG